MGFKGIFIGIDKYVDPNTPELTAARRDALALWSLFLDTAPGMESHLLINKLATKSAISAVLSHCLETAEPDDAVIIFFAGHGSRNHRLVCFDTVREFLSETSIGMESLADNFKSSKAKAILLVLDCCFSGKAPARIMEDTPVERDDVFPWRELAMSGKGRIIVSASGVNETAMETSGGHGLLTSALMQVLESGMETVDLLSAMGEVSNVVRAEALKMGHDQNPVVFCYQESSLTLPVLKRGENFFSAFPEYRGIKVTAPIRNLSKLGIPTPVLDEWERSFKNGLNELQLAAVNDHRILDGESLLVIAPTSSGKTFIGEMAAVKSVTQGKKAVFVLPYKALVNEKFEQFTDLYSERLGVRVIRCDGDHGEQIEIFMKGKYDIALFTFETFLSLAVGHSFVLNQIGLIVVDEAQFITDPTRGINVELLFTYLLSIRERNVRPQIIALSAVIGAVNDFDSWLGVNSLVTTARPVPLVEGVLDRRGCFQFVDVQGQVKIEQLLSPEVIIQRGEKPSAQDIVVPLVKKIIRDNSSEKIIVFRNVKGKAEGCAKYLANELNLPPATEVEAELPNNDMSRSSSSLREALRGGTAFHSANLQRQEKMVIERAFRDQKGKVRVLGATSTVAAGINTPASTVVLAEKEFLGEDDRPFTVAEYKNMAGRAGRLGYNEIGRSIILADSPIEREQLFLKYVLAKPERIASSFHPDHIETWFVRLLAQFPRILSDEAIKLLSCTYAGYLENKKSPGWQDRTRGILENFLRHLKQFELIEEEEGYIKLTLLGRACSESTLNFNSAMRLVELLKLLPPGTVTPMVLMAVVQGLNEMDQQGRIPLIRKGPKEEVWTHEAARIFGYDVAKLLQRHCPRDASDYYARCKKAVFLSDWITGLSIQNLEDKYTLVDNSFYRLTYGSITSVTGMTRMLLKPASKIASLILLGQQSIGEGIDQVLKRIEFGLSEEALPLLDLPIRMERGDYLNLFSNGIRTPEQFWVSPQDKLESIIGKGLLGRFEKHRKITA